MPSSNALDPQSPQARAIYELAIHSTIIFALIFVIVTGAIIYPILRFRARAGEPDPRQIPDNRKVEIAWRLSNLFKQRTTADNLTKGRQVWLKTSRN